jgi:hypothetical protein
MAQRETLRDNSYRTIGFLETESNGNKTLYDAQWRLLGFYRREMNRTFDRDWRPVAQGDLLATLLRS